MNRRSKVARLALCAASALIALEGVAIARPPSWDTVIAGSGRFKVLTKFASEAVLDKETGLVWERSPSLTLRTWPVAVDHCLGRTTGGRRGWRLPTYAELTSIFDASTALVASPHPFTVTPPPSFYWSAQTSAHTSTTAKGFASGVGDGGGGPKTGHTAQAWCVRGGSGFDTRP